MYFSSRRINKLSIAETYLIEALKWNPWMCHAYEILCDMGCQIPSETFFTLDECIVTTSIENSSHSDTGTTDQSTMTSITKSPLNEPLSPPPSLTVQNTLPFLSHLDSLESNNGSTPVTPRYLRNQ
jgi:hypothetical protein